MKVATTRLKSNTLMNRSSNYDVNRFNLYVLDENDKKEFWYSDIYVNEDLINFTTSIFNKNYEFRISNFSEYYNYIYIK